MESVLLRPASASTPLLRCSSSKAFFAGARPLQLVGGDRRLSARRAPPTTGIARAAASLPLTLPAEYGYVVLTAAAAAFLVQWQAVQVGAQRRKAGIKYPKMYEDAEPSLFNCYQRAHQNTLETYPSFLALLAIGGLAYPVTSTAFGLLWLIGRVVYTLGYYTGDPSKRSRGLFHFFGLVGLFVTCSVLGVRQTGLLSLIKS